MRLHLNEESVTQKIKNKPLPLRATIDTELAVWTCVRFTKKGFINLIAVVKIFERINENGLKNNGFKLFPFFHVIRLIDLFHSDVKHRKYNTKFCWLVGSIKAKFDRLVGSIKLRVTSDFPRLTSLWEKSTGWHRQAVKSRVFLWEKQLVLAFQYPQGNHVLVKGDWRPLGPESNDRLTKPVKKRQTTLHQTNHLTTDLTR